MTLETVQTIRVEGMTCPHCEASVSRNISKLDGIYEVIADRNSAEVKISGSTINLTEIERIVTEIGYQYKGIVS